jgi:hypothetical protein
MGFIDDTICKILKVSDYYSIGKMEVKDVNTDLKGLLEERMRTSRMPKSWDGYMTVAVDVEFTNPELKKDPSYELHNEASQSAIVQPHILMHVKLTYDPIHRDTAHAQITEVDFKGQERDIDEEFRVLDIQEGPEHKISDFTKSYIRKSVKRDIADTIQKNSLVYITAFFETMYQEETRKKERGIPVTRPNIAVLKP